jgi:hypothetical protein
MKLDSGSASHMSTFAVFSFYLAEHMWVGFFRHVLMMWVGFCHKHSYGVEYKIEIEI